MIGEFQIIGVIVQSGSVGISLALIWYINQNSKRHNETITNYLKGSTKVLKQVANTNIKTAQCLTKIVDRLDQLISKI